MNGVCGTVQILIVSNKVHETVKWGISADRENIVLKIKIEFNKKEYFTKQRSGFATG